MMCACACVVLSRLRSPSLCVPSPIVPVLSRAPARGCLPQRFVCVQPTCSGDTYISNTGVVHGAPW
eukprot:scaffold3637_cov146-Isochrysis_galbana.AAC.2